ncbi:MAG: hypothetical protein Q8Q23_02335 [bacterium]|nr:hypothetical protein [bacterium]
MYICITHSPRTLDFSRSSINFLKKRYSSSKRLDSLKKFEKLSKKNSPDWTNNVSVWKLNSKKLKMDCLLFLERDYTANHAIIDKGSLLICGNTFFEKFNLKSKKKQFFTHNWFAGGHTIYKDPKTEQFCISCSSSDSVLFFNPRNKKFTKTLRMPEKLYGCNYDLKPTDDVRKHYISNDAQLTHINCCYPCEKGYLTTSFIQGAIGLFDFKNNYKELTSGFLGCHGARTRLGLNGFYFSDSPSGCLYEMNWKGKIIRKFNVKSKWLHDTQWIKDDIYLFSLSDSNTLQLWDINKSVMLWSIDVSAYGKTSLLISTS